MLLTFIDEVNIVIEEIAIVRFVVELSLMNWAMFTYQERFRHFSRDNER